MNKAQLIDAVTDAAGVPKGVVEKVVDAVIQSILDAMRKGEPVTLVGFGTFKISERAARTGRNPRTGESIEISAAKVPKFLAGKAFKDAVN